MAGLQYAPSNALMPGTKSSANEVSNINIAIQNNFIGIIDRTASTFTCSIDAQNISTGISTMITAAQLRAARALLDIDQRQLAELSGLSVPTIQRMEASEGVVRGNVDSLMKLIEALNQSGIELIGDGAASQTGGRGVRLKEPALSDSRHVKGMAKRA
ncbi:MULTISPECIES: helix-turn-helix transcriptional regulator [unclassified Bradyrhizobium]|uniref:helix-turn-helix domain-containing protein n=2 Tax=unclassified Bradyrhizobium TaxID=2631580 RepID=UPI0028E8FE10|nr:MULTISPECIES: helix-turn-helix transcriptional regulator [unclassified Bradyrhizobium]